MKKYFMAGTDDEIQFGDELELDFTRDTKKGTVHHHMEIKFIPEMVDMLLNEEVIDIREEDSEEEEKNYNIPIEERLDDLLEDFECLEKRVEDLEGDLTALKMFNADILAKLDKMSNHTDKEPANNPSTKVSKKPNKK